MPKIVKGGPMGISENPICCKISKIGRGPFETLKISGKIVAQSRNNKHAKMLVK